MSRRTLLNLSLAAIVVALGLVAYFRPIHPASRRLDTGR
jgi:hypothetical protein